MPPPAPDRGYGKGGGIVISAHVHETAIKPQVIDAIRESPGQGWLRKVMILTGQHSKIDWNRYRIKEAPNTNPIALHHMGLYQYNQALLKVIGEHIPYYGDSGYSNFMTMMAKWYEETRFTETVKRFGEGKRDGARRPEPESRPNGQEDDFDEDTGNNSPSDPEGGTGEPEEEINQTNPPLNESPEREETEEDETDYDTDPEREINTGEKPARRSDPKPPGEETEGDGPEDDLEDVNGAGEPFDEREPVNEGEPFDNEEETPFPASKSGPIPDPVLPGYTPLVVNPNRIRPSHIPQEGSGQSRINRLPIPFLRPDDPVTDLIRETSELDDFNRWVDAFTPGKIGQVEGLIRDILSDRATEQAWKGYSVALPLTISRKNAFELAFNQTPVIWDREIGIEPSPIDIYIDVSGSMRDYYGFIPLIYDALRFVRGKVFEFSDQVFEADFESGFFQTTGGTNFNAVASHIIERGTKAVIVVSDGGSHLTRVNFEALQVQLEALVYLKVEDNKDRNWEEIATQVIVLGKEE